MKYTDPTGEEIWCTWNRERNQEAENLIREIIGQKRYDKFVKRLNHNGDDGYALVLNINEEDIEQFTEIDLGDGEAGLRLGMADLLSSTTVTEVRTDGNFINANGDLTRADSDAGCGRVGVSYSGVCEYKQTPTSLSSRQIRSKRQMKRQRNNREYRVTESL
ncbi:MAG: hypothetical protein IPJ30_28110 [Acidobacteria bacterium]|nr:hypothetical protein [Acidobacteriota bacterium]